MTPTEPEKKCWTLPLEADVFLPVPGGSWAGLSESERKFFRTLSLRVRSWLKLLPYRHLCVEFGTGILTQKQLADLNDELFTLYRETFSQQCKRLPPFRLRQHTQRIFALSLQYRQTGNCVVLVSK